MLSYSFDLDLDVSLFETTIRIVGGLLGAYELTTDHALLLKAKVKVSSLRLTLT